MRNAHRSFVFILASAAVANCQPPGTGTPVLNRTCNLANTRNNGNIRIDCDFDSEQRKKLIDLLNAVLAKKDFAAINANIDELLAIALKRAPTVPGVINVASQLLPAAPQFEIPRGASLAERQRLLNERRSNLGTESGEIWNPGFTMIFQVDSAFLNPMFLVRCDYSCAVTNVLVNSAFVGAPSSQTNHQDEVLVSLGGRQLLPNDVVNITVRSWSSQPVDSMTVEAYFR